MPVSVNRTARRRRAGKGQLVDVEWDHVGHVGVDAEQFRRRLHAHQLGDDRAPVATLATGFGMSTCPNVVSSAVVRVTLG